MRDHTVKNALDRIVQEVQAALYHKFDFDASRVDRQIKDLGIKVVVYSVDKIIRVDIKPMTDDAMATFAIPTASPKVEEKAEEKVMSA